jgi:hypothetical protein
MLYFERLVTEGTKSAAMSVDTLLSDVHSGLIRIAASGGEVQAGTGPLVYLECLVLIGDQQTTPLTLVPWFDFSSGKARVYTRKDGTFSLIDYCDNDNRRLVHSVNGFMPSTTIEYSVPTDGYAELTICDAMGRTIQSLAQGRHAAGKHLVTFHAGHLPSGVYLYTLRHASGRQTRAMILSK